MHDYYGIKTVTKKLSCLSYRYSSFETTYHISLVYNI